MAKEPLIFRIPIRDFDLTQLPQEAQTPGSDAFRIAVGLYFAGKYANEGLAATVAIDSEGIEVCAAPEGMSLMDHALDLCGSGQIREATPILEFLRQQEPDNAEIAYTYGLALSETGAIDKAIEHLNICVKLAPGHVNAWVAIGVAEQRLGHSLEAEQALRKAMTLDPANGWAQGNLAAILANAGKLDEAIPHFRNAARRRPSDATPLLGLAKALESLGGDHMAEVNGIYDEIIRRFRGQPAAEIAMAAQTAIAHRALRKSVDGAIRMDVVHYMIDALQQFGAMPKKQVGEIVSEIAVLGRAGLSINDPDKRYSLHSLPGDFSGLQLLSMMHAGFRLFDEHTHTGADFDKELSVARATMAK
ncbi:MAG: tetratricopeptide repeat protein [Burkholderiales bacterium]